MTSNADFLHQAQALIPAEVRMISGCEDYQSSADVSNIVTHGLPDPKGRAGGACTSALLGILYGRSSNTTSGASPHDRSGDESSNVTFQEVLMRLREDLAKDGFSQIPQLTSSRPLDLQDEPFRLVGCKEGARRALLCGINYVGQDGELSGCHNDVFQMKRYIQDEHGFPETDITVLLDDGSHPNPTRSSMIRVLQKLVAESKSGDSVFFHYSGHGGLLEPDGNALKNKRDEHDQTLIPVNYEMAGQIRDYSLFNHFVQPMARGVMVTCVMDCCHSGSVLDLPYTFKATTIGEAPRMVEDVSLLSNLAFLFTLAGGILPEGFEGVASSIGDIVGENLEDFLGAGVDSEALADFADDNLGGNDNEDAGDDPEEGIDDDDDDAVGGQAEDEELDIEDDDGDGDDDAVGDQAEDEELDGEDDDDDDDDDEDGDYDDDDEAECCVLL